MDSKEFFVAPGNRYGYGDRIFIRDSASPSVKDILARMCMWGGHDKTMSLENGEVVWGFEFPIAWSASAYSIKASTVLAGIGFGMTQVPLPIG